MTTPPIPTTTDDLIAELDLCMRADCGIELESADIRALIAERADLKKQLVAAGITAENCEMFRKDAERYRLYRMGMTSPEALDANIDAAMRQ